jgi:thiol-disulfide isomerase/thioredoxin
MPKYKRSNRKQHNRKKTPTFLILAGIVLLLIAVFVLKSSSAPSTSIALLESKFDQALMDGKPTFVFLHSLDCIPCKEMMGTVAEVYPDFQESVVLIDVDVYDQRNKNILRREGIQSIPTLVFYDNQGIRQVVIGIMAPNLLRSTLQDLIGN